ncbi:MAG: hypothetical protein ACE5F1_06450 [Planctomycetota bacterium]
MKALQVIQSAYRCTVEEQDDPAVWIAHAMKGAGGELDVLLRGSAVNYAVRDQDASGLSIGGRVHACPPEMDRDILALTERGVEVFVVTEDAAERGIDASRFVSGVKEISRSRIPALFAEFDQIWNW